MLESLRLINICLPAVACLKTIRMPHIRVQSWEISAMLQDAPLSLTLMESSNCRPALETSLWPLGAASLLLHIV